MKTSLILIFILSLSVTAFAQHGWQPFSGPCGNDFDFVSDSSGVVLSGQNVYFTVDGGATWTNSNLPPGTPKSIHLSSPGNATVFGYLYQSAYLNYYWRVSSSDTGRSWNGGIEGGGGMGWEIIDKYPGHYYYGSARIGYEVYGCGTVWDDVTGRSYHIPPSSHSLIGIQHIAFSGNVGFASMSDNTLFRTLDSGASWSQVKYQTIDSFYTGSGYGGGYVVYPSPDGSWFILYGNSIYKSLDTGFIWSIHQSYPTSPISIRINFHGIGYLTLAGQDYIMATIDSGRTWFPQGIGFPGPSYIFQFSDHEAVIAGCQFVKTTNGGGGRSPVLSMPRTIDFGAMDLGVQVHKNIILRNVSDSTIRIDSLISDSLGLKMTPASIEIPPHDSIGVDLTLAISKGGVFQGKEALVTNTGLHTEPFVITGSGNASVLVATPDTLQFGITKLQEMQRKHFKLSNISQVGGLLDTAYTDNPHFRLTSGIGDSIGVPAPYYGGGYLFLTVEYRPVSVGRELGRLFLVSGEGNIDTVWLEGTGISTREGAVSFAWAKTERDPGDTLSHIAGTLLLADDSIFVMGAHQTQNFAYQTVAYNFQKDGELLSEIALPTPTSMYDEGQIIISDKGEGYYILSHSSDADWLHYIDRSRDGSLLGHIDNVNNDQYAAMSAEVNQSVLILTNGLSSHGPDIRFSEFGPQGTVLMDDQIWGPSRYYDARDPSVPHNGINEATCLVQGRGGVTYVSAYLDQTVEDNWWDGALPHYYGYLYAVSGTTLQTFYEDHQYYDIAAIALDSDQNIYEAIRSGDTLLAQKIDASGSLVWSRVLQTGVQGLSDPVFMAADQSGGVFISYGHDTPYESRDIATLHFSASTGAITWITEFDGLGGAADIIKKMSLDPSGNACVLIQSADTVKADIVFLKYAPDGHELYRLRYAGPNGGQALPSDFTLTDKGEIFICGGSQIDTGYTDIALIKYEEPKNSVAQRQVQPMTVSLSPNPWHTAAFLSFENPGQEPVEVSIVDILGRTFRTYSTDRSYIRIEREGLPIGMYTLIIRDGSKETALTAILD